MGVEDGGRGAQEAGQGLQEDLPQQADYRASSQGGEKAGGGHAAGLLKVLLPQLPDAMVGIASGAVLNIGLDPLLIFNFGLGVAGAAWATIISQFVSFCLLLAGCSKGGNLHIHISRVQLTKAKPRALTAKRKPKEAFTQNQGIFFIPLVYILSRSLGLLGVEMTQSAADILTLLCGRHARFRFSCFQRVGSSPFRRTSSGIPLTAAGLLGVEMTQSAADVLTLLCAVPIQLRALREMDALESAQSPPFLKKFAPSQRNGAARLVCLIF